MAASVIVISDLHLGDVRNSLEFEKSRLSALGEFLKKENPSLVLNLGDTVSREEFLRPGTCGMDYFEYYMRWRNSSGLSFAECAIAREEPFFEKFFGQDMDSFRAISEDCGVITLAPFGDFDHTFRPEQLDFLEERLHSFCGRYILIGTHVPFKGACSRFPGEGIFLTDNPELDRILAAAKQQIFWAGGHFHWQMEAVDANRRFCPFIGGRFRFDSIEGKESYLRRIDFYSDKAVISDLTGNF